MNRTLSSRVLSSATLRALAGLAFATLAACSSSDTTSSTSDCHAGDSVACTCDNGQSGHKVCGASACDCGSGSSSTDSGSTPPAADAAPTVDPDAGNGEHLHDSSPPDGSGTAPGTYGADCKTNADCTDAVFNTCFAGGNRDFCTKTCKAAADCPSPPTPGVCNMKGFCK